MEVTAFQGQTCRKSLGKLQLDFLGWKVKQIQSQEALYIIEGNFLLKSAERFSLSSKVSDVLTSYVRAYISDQRRG